MQVCDVHQRGLKLCDGSRPAGPHLLQGALLYPAQQLCAPPTDWYVPSLYYVQ